MIVVEPKSGFDWALVCWAGPDEPAPEACSYCHTEIQENEAPLMALSADGRMARFCDPCAGTWFEHHFTD